MIKLNYAALATGASLDSASGNVTLFNVIEEVRVPQDRLPLHIPEVAFVGSFTRIEGDIAKMGFQLDYIMPNGKTISVNKSEPLFQGDRMRVVMRLNGMPIEVFGRHKLRVSWRWGNLTLVGAEDEDDREGSFDIFLDVLPFEMMPPGSAVN
jgi:hypothetical protein